MLWECKCGLHTQKIKTGPMAPSEKRMRPGARVSTQHPLLAPERTEQGQWDGDLLGRLNGPWATESQEVVCPLQQGCG